jgi:hypothetical protein
MNPKNIKVKLAESSYHEMCKFFDNLLNLNIEPTKIILILQENFGEEYADLLLRDYRERGLW